MSHSSSRTWKSPAVVARERWSRILKMRDHICPDSPFLPATGFNLDVHRAAMAAAYRAFTAQKAWASEQDALALSIAPFAGRPLASSRSAVLAERTIWSDAYPAPGVWASPWPTVGECKAMGDERVAEGVKMGRKLAVPRYPALADQDWREVEVKPASGFDRVGLGGQCSDFECGVSDWEAVHLLGGDLLLALDMVGVYQ